MAQRKKAPSPLMRNRDSDLHGDMSTQVCSTDAANAGGGLVSLPAELWWPIVGEVASTATRDRLAVSLACRLFRAIVAEWGDPRGPSARGVVA